MPTEMQERAQEVTEAFDVLGRAQVAQVPLLPDPVQRRWGHLRMLASDLHAARPVATDTPDRADWTELKLARARDDVTAYLGYVRRTLVALIDENVLPADAPPPYLRRVDAAA